MNESKANGNVSVILNSMNEFHDYVALFHCHI